MDYRFDQKGKYYTTHVSKRSAQVQALVEETLISGTMYLLLDNRVKDELNGGERFIAITDARVHDLSGKLLYETHTLIVNKDHIVWLFPTAEHDTHHDSEHGAATT